MVAPEGTSTTDGHPQVPGGRRGDLFDAACPTRSLLDRLGSKWTVMIVLTLAEAGREMRFGALRRAVSGVSQKMLTQTLRQLEVDGLVVRRVEPARPPSVHYSLTDLATSLTPVLRELREWAEAHMAEIDDHAGPQVPAGMR